MTAELESLQSGRSELPDQIVKLGLKAGASDVIGSVETEHRRMVRFSNNSITVVKTWDVTSPMIYLGWGRRSIASRVSDTSVKTVEDTIRQMVPAAKALPESDTESHLPKGPFKYRTTGGSFDPKIPALEKELVDAVETAINAALKEGAKRVSGVLSAYHSIRTLRTSAKAEGRSEQTSIDLTVRGFASDDASGQGISVATNMRDFNPENAGREAGRFAKMSLNPKLGEAGKYNVVFGPAIFANFMDRVSFSSSAYFVDAGFSFFVDKLGKKVGSEGLTITDDRLRPDSPGATPFDDEGHPSQTTRLVDHGTLKTYVHDSRTAAKFKAAQTGNAVWVSEAGQIVPIPTSMVVEPGDRTVEQLIHEARNGLYITNTWYTRFQNYQTSDFSTIPRDAILQIKDGKLAGPVKGVRVSDNMLRILQNIRASSKDQTWIRWWEVEIPTRLGHYLVNDVGITKSTQ